VGDLSEERWEASEEVEEDWSMAAGWVALPAGAVEETGHRMRA
jgi:hypothetical protein